MFFLVIKFFVKNWKKNMLAALLLTMLTFLFFIGNTILKESAEGLRNSYTENFTGDLAVFPQSEESLSIFGVNNPAIGEFFSIPVLKNRREIQDMLDANDKIDAYTFQLTGFAAMDIAGRRYQSLIFGVDPASYFSFFPGIEVTEGSTLRSQEKGLLLSEKQAQQIKRETGRSPSPGDMVMLSSLGEMGFRILELPLCGIYRNRGDIELLNEVVIADADTVRALNSVMVAGDFTPADDAVSLLDANTQLDDLFASQFIDEPEAAGGDLGELSIDELRKQLSSPRAKRQGEGSWNFMLLRTAAGTSSKAIARQLRPQLSALGAEPVLWHQAAGPAAMLVLLLQALFNGGYFLVMIAGIIGIANMFLVAVFRRTSDIGTLRAVGAEDRDIRLLVYGENVAVALASGTIGVFLASLLFGIVNSRALSIENSLVVALLGRSTFHFEPHLDTALVSILLSVASGLVASLFPVRKALQIEPVVAMRRG
ncbi:ABC transporter permease [Sediminispirochaeta smaragdinae]|uniref:ABC3 transporter permease C-terminal domain-containing protein n=1 Tax=Sediminispirochaeta smaragdinae (strain DSM 11293 / JCM 15392 / SEBR 4228) TaxID=573413 RepID=E1RBX0_SEDSS|nr:ABC transporter permease [Sediminispirochaeta smaragdinae]ADK79850.1 protein of unknown function DUF214 [Sediminispirochaeta smaragdinae DSM 11293]